MIKNPKPATRIAVATALMTLPLLSSPAVAQARDTALGGPLLHRHALTSALPGIRRPRLSRWGRHSAYAGDLCVALNLADGRPVARVTIPSASAGYVFQQSLTDPSQLYLTALQGDTFCGLSISVDDDVLRWETVGLENEPFAGPVMDNAAIKLDVGGEWMGRYDADGTEVLAEAEEALPEGLRFVGSSPGFLDKDHVLSAVAEEDSSPTSRHLLLDARTLVPFAEVSYPGTDFLDPLSLGDGTWLTVHGDLVHR